MGKCMECENLLCVRVIDCVVSAIGDTCANSSLDNVVEEE